MRDRFATHFMNVPRIVLASASPRRALLLKQLFGDFLIVPSTACELHHDQFTVRELARLNSYRKARDVAREYPQSIVLGADTLVCIGDELFGKPLDLDQAHAMLERLQGQTHQVVTGVCLLQRDSHRLNVFAVCTDVRFKPLGAAEIDRYLASIDPLDKAGAYAIQEGGDRIVDNISGSFSNVVGLPLERLKIELAAWGITTYTPAQSLPGTIVSG